MLMFGEAGSGGWGNGPRSMILGMFVVSPSPPSTHKRASPSSSSWAIGVLIFLPLSSSMSPVCLRRPSTLHSHIPSPISSQGTTMEHNNPPCHCRCHHCCRLGRCRCHRFCLPWSLLRRDGGRYQISGCSTHSCGVQKSWSAAIGPNVDAGDSGYIAMQMGHVFEAVAECG